MQYRPEGPIATGVGILLLVLRGRRIVPARLVLAPTHSSMAGCTISMPRTRGSAVAVVAFVIAAGLLTPATGRAQGVDLGFSLGFYDPVGSMVERGSPASPATYFQQRLQATPSLGANVVWWKSSRLGFAGSVYLSPSNVALTDTTGTHDHSSTVMLISARVLYAFTPMLFKPAPGHRDLPWSYYVGAGLGVASRSGAIWTYSSGLVAPALLLNAGVRTVMGPRVVVRFDLDDYISQAQFDKGLVTETASRTHNDFILSLTLSYRIVR